MTIHIANTVKHAAFAKKVIGKPVKLYYVSWTYISFITGVKEIDILIM